MKTFGFFSKKVFGKKVAYCRKPQKDPLSSINVFLQTENFKEFKGVRFDKIQNFSEKCRIVPKKRKGEGPFGLHYTFEA